MSNLTSEQLDQLADRLDEVSDAIREYVRTNFDNLSREDRKRLRSMASSITILAQNIEIQSALVAIPDFEEAVGRIEEATGAIKDFLDDLEKINKIIKISAAAISLGGAIISRNPAKVVAELEDLVNVISEE
ncbi:MAG: hypothetical protein KI790_06025 [Cyclobacteriaceae bacterium]|nr:hypothetical protein [Cyclobacteriaceae bacterium HetDA_MAG_MS6]